MAGYLNLKVIIAGSRTITDYAHVEAAMAQFQRKHGRLPSEVVSGGAAGADRLGEVWAQRRGIPVRHVLPDWQEHGRAAGPIRNREMAVYANALCLLWDGRSPGSRSMLEEATKRGLLITVYRVPTTVTR